MTNGIEVIFKGFFVFLILTVILIGVSFYAIFIKDNKKIETKTKPKISWKLEANNQVVDTIWVYDFKN